MKKHFSPRSSGKHPPNNPGKQIGYAWALLLICAFGSSAGESARYLAQGDSYTIGEAVDYSQRWPEQLAKRQAEQGVAIDAPLIIARTDWTTRQLLAGIERKKSAGTFDLVSLMIGVKNQYRR